MDNDGSADSTWIAPNNSESALPAADSFVDLRLTGGRFERRGFPVSGLAELERLEELIETVAKALWKRDNPTRQRVPNNFTSVFDLRLIRVDPGSVKSSVC